MSWKCDKCRNRIVITENGFTDEVCLKRHWVGDDGADEDYKKNNPDPWNDCKDFEVE